ncbi:acetolactate synthase large subunit [Kytococcus sp. Marseille-QA3725]
MGTTTSTETTDHRTATATIADRPLTGAEALVATLQRLGVQDVFGLPGGAVLPLYDALYSAPDVRHVLVRHEQGAGHAAAGYALATGRVGVCLATSGPGATNLVTPLADANMDSVPVVALTGNVASSAIGSDAFQEADIRSVVMPVTKHSFFVTDADDIVPTVVSAFELAASGRPGPVLVDVTKDALAGLTAVTEATPRELPGYHPPQVTPPGAVTEAAELIRTSERPVLYVGGGVMRSGATAELRELAELTGLPVVTTLTALGAFPSSHPQHLGMPGMHGTVAAVTALQKADLLVALGARFDDRVTGARDSFAPGARVVHADVDPSEIGKNRAVDVALPGDARATLGALCSAWRERPTDEATAAAHTAWRERTGAWKARFPRGYEPTTDGGMSPQYVIERLGAIAGSGPDTVFCSGVGQHQMWASQFLDHEHPDTWINSGGLGTMGFAVPAAMGAKAARPEATVWAIDGDGCFQMTNQELATCAVEGIPIKVAVVNNAGLGMVRQWQTLFYDQRLSHSVLPSEQVPDVVGLAEAMGCVGLRCTSEDDVDDTLRAAMAVTDRPVVVDFRVSSDAMVWPMVPAGTSNDAIQYARDQRPDFDDE